MSWMFGGDDDTVSFDDHAALTLPDADWSVAGWVKLISNVGTQSQYICSWNTYAANPSFQLIGREASRGVDPDKFEANLLGTAANGFGVSAGTEFGTSTAWQHLAIVRSGSTVTVYRDGTSWFTLSANPGGINHTAAWYFGRNANHPTETDRSLNGKMAEWAKWDRALTGGEITNLAVLTTGTLPETLPTSLAWHARMYDAFTEQIAGLTVANTNATIDSADHPLTRGAGRTPNVGAVVITGLAPVLVFSGASTRTPSPAALSLTGRTPTLAGQGSEVTGAQIRSGLAMIQSANLRRVEFVSMDPADAARLESGQEFKFVGEYALFFTVASVISVAPPVVVELVETYNGGKSVGEFHAYLIAIDFTVTLGLFVPHPGDVDLRDMIAENMRLIDAALS